MIYWKYFQIVLQHKFFILKYGLTFHIPILNLIFHDWDKLLLNFKEYADYFLGEKSTENHYKFKVAWLEHQNRNKHHWEFWVMFVKDGMTFIEIPFPHVFEMIADWCGAGEVYGMPVLEWYTKNIKNIHLHPATRDLVESVLLDL